MKNYGYIYKLFFCWLHITSTQKKKDFTHLHNKLLLQQCLVLLLHQNIIYCDVYLIISSLAMEFHQKMLQAYLILLHVEPYEKY